EQGLQRFERCQLGADQVMGRVHEVLQRAPQPPTQRMAANVSHVTIAERRRGNGSKSAASRALFARPDATSAEGQDKLRKTIIAGCRRTLSIQNDEGLATVK